MMFNRVINLLILMISSSGLFSQLPELVSGSLERIENFPSEYVNVRNVDVWLPEGYGEQNKYAVLYMHDGQMLFDSTTTWNGQEWEVDEVMSALLKEGKIRNTIVVAIWNDGQNRWSDYNPQKALNYLSQGLQDSAFSKKMFAAPNADNYLKFIVKELKPLIDTKFSTLPGKENTFVLGSSMGGLISMYAICEYPDVFGGAACLSTHWVGDPDNFHEEVPNAYARYLKTNLPDPKTHKIYFDSGTETLDQYYKPWQEKVDKIMLDNGYSSTSWMTKEFVGDAHDEKSWAERLDIPLVFLLGKE